MTSSNGTVSALFHYPLKGFSPQEETQLTVTKGEAFPLDRLYAIEDGPSGFDPAAPTHLSKTKFICLAKYAALCGLETHYDDESRILTISRHYEQVARADLSSPLGRHQIEEFIKSYMGDALEGEPKILSTGSHHFTDKAGPLIHIISLSSISALISQTGLALHPLRFRANIHLTGFEPFAEETWLGKRLKCGDVEFEIIEQTKRCAAINVDPITAERGENITPLLHKLRGSPHFGVYAKIIKGGTLETNSPAVIQE